MELSRRERFRERDVIVCDFEPNPEMKVSQGLGKFGSTLAGTVWIDPQDKQVVRLESRFIEPFKFRDGAIWATFSKGSTYVVEATFVNNEIWLPAQIDINVGVRMFMVGFSSNIVTRYSDYKRFRVDAEKEKLKDPIEPKKP